MNNRGLKNCRGLSLIELIIVLMLLVSVVTVSFTVYLLGVKAYHGSVKRMDIQHNIRHAAGFINKKLLSASFDDIIVVKVSNGPDRLHIGSTFLEVRGDILRVDHNYNQGNPNFNPLAEGITDFEVDVEGNLVKVVITGGSRDDGTWFSLATEVWMRR